MLGINRNASGVRTPSSWCSSRHSGSTQNASVRSETASRSARSATHQPILYNLLKFKQVSVSSANRHLTCLMQSSFQKTLRFRKINIFATARFFNLESFLNEFYNALETPFPIVLIVFFWLKSYVKYTLVISLGDTP